MQKALICGLPSRLTSHFHCAARGVLFRLGGIGERDQPVGDGAQAHHLRVRGRCQGALLRGLLQHLAVLLRRLRFDLVGRNQARELGTIAHFHAFACPGGHGAGRGAGHHQGGEAAAAVQGTAAGEQGVGGSVSVHGVWMWQKPVSGPNHPRLTAAPQVPGLGRHGPVARGAHGRKWVTVARGGCRGFHRARRRSVRPKVRACPEIERPFVFAARHRHSTKARHERDTHLGTPSDHGACCSAPAAAASPTFRAAPRRLAHRRPRAASRRSSLSVTA